MNAFIAGICLKGDHTICPPNSFEVPAIFAASGAFLLLALIGFAWLGYRSKR